MTIGYGQTEASPLITRSRSTIVWSTALATVGPRLPAMEVKIASADRRNRSAGQPGRAVCPRSRRHDGLLQEPEATARAIDPEGWLHTGDLAVHAARRLLPHHRPLQGHDHPRRREHLSRGDRGVLYTPIPPSPTCR